MLSNLAQTECLNAALQERIYSVICIPHPFACWAVDSMCGSQKARAAHQQRRRPGRSLTLPQNPKRPESTRDIAAAVEAG
mmetsp:Transcript_11496/g.34532  ORF Transcript_11496/g.34532 Transcript_11496/m.34532 type:complete len:80 (+) Transcript_11496:624-863(+)